MDARKKRAARQRRHERVARTVRGTVERPRLSVYRSNAHIYAQVIDDTSGRTVASASSLDGGITADEADKSGVARKVGALVAERAQQAGVSRVVFDRGGFRYAGRVRALAEAAREAGLDF